MKTVDVAQTGEREEPTALSQDDILGLAELAIRWHVTKQRVAELTEKRLPHWKKLACGRIWLLSEVKKFEETWTRRSGIHITPKEDPEEDE